MISCLVSICWRGRRHTNKICASFHKEIEQIGFGRIFLCLCCCLSCYDLLAPVPLSVSFFQQKQGFACIEKCEFGRCFTRVKKLFNVHGTHSIRAQQVAFFRFSHVSFRVVVIVRFLSLVMRGVGRTFENGRVQWTCWSMFRPPKQPTALWLVTICLAVVGLVTVLPAMHAIAIMHIFAGLLLGEMCFFIITGFERCFVPSIILSLGSSGC